MAEYIEREALLKGAHIGMTRITDTDMRNLNISQTNKRGSKR